MLMMIRPPSPDDEESTDADDDEEMDRAIFLEEEPPSVSDHYIQKQFHGVGLLGDNQKQTIPLFFQHRQRCVSYTLMQVVDYYTRGGLFYIGATVNPRRRWLGCRGMPGHCRSGWDMMIVIAYTTEGMRVETELIKFSKNVYGARCCNRAEDSRGQCRGAPNFIYVCC